MEPTKKDPIVVLKAQYRGEKGELVAIDGSDGVVKLPSVSIALEVVDLANLGKLKVAG